METEGLVAIDFIRYADFRTNQYLKEVATGQTQTVAKGTLWQASLNPQTGKIVQLRELLDRDCEFPVVPPQSVGQGSRYTYLSMQRDGVDISKELFGAITRFDRGDDTLVVADFGANRYPSEPIYVPDALNPEQGWVLTVVYDGNADTSEVQVLDSDALDREPVCRLGLPHVIPHSFHGKWQPAR
jgi:carotenoid cleavage dioxygenase-like enzyme